MRDDQLQPNRANSEGQEPLSPENQQMLVTVLSNALLQAVEKPQQKAEEPKEFEIDLIELFKNGLDANLIYVDATDRFLDLLAGVSDPESKRRQYGENSLDGQWFPGDSILSAIGQSENRFTPLQLCVYACTLANQGTRYRATFLNRVVSSDYRELIKENQPEIMGTPMEISWETYDMYMKGMRKVVTELGGTARKYFGGREDPDGIGSFPVAVCAKTGTAEVGGEKRPNAMLAGFVADSNYPLAFIVCVEEGGYGAAACLPIASSVLKTCAEAMKVNG